MRSRMGILRNIKVMFITSLFLLGSLFILMSIPAFSGGISVMPPDVTITMKDVFPEKIEFNVGVENLYRHDINVSAKIEKQISYRLTENYTDMPDLSWVKITPNIVHLSAKKSKLLNVTIDIPDEEKPLNYNKRWEFVVVFSEIKDNSTPIKTEIAITIHIETPKSAKMQMPSSYILFVIVGGFMILIVFILYVKNKKRTLTGEKAVVFYFKKRKLKNK